jgi:Protein of unknown function (DUF1572)
MDDTLAQHYLENALRNFRQLKALAEKAMAQVDDEDFFRQIDDESNSIALIVKHLAGNLRSRWTDFLNSDGEKPDRDRDSEFITEESDTRAALLQSWEAGWLILFDAVGSLAPTDLLRKVRIRGEQYTVVAAINRQLTHYGNHVGQIVFLAKHLRSKDWQTLSIARGKSGTFNAEMNEKFSGA